MIKINSCASVIFLTSFLCVPAFADDSAPSSLSKSLSGNVAVVSEYSFRGISQSDERPALQGGIDWNHDGGFYLGSWGSSVDFNDGDEASVEIDLYGGMKGAIDDLGLTWDLGLIYYAYPGADSALDYDFIEGKIALGHDFSVFALTASLNYSPDYFASSGDSFYWRAGASVPLPHDFALNGSVAYQAIDDNVAFAVPDYMDWSLGLSYSWEGVGAAITYVDTDLDRTDCADGCASKAIFSLSYAF